MAVRPPPPRCFGAPSSSKLRRAARHEVLGSRLVTSTAGAPEARATTGSSGGRRIHGGGAERGGRLRKVTIGSNELAANIQGHDTRRGKREESSGPARGPRQRRARQPRRRLPLRRRFAGVARGHSVLSSRVSTNQRDGDISPDSRARHPELLPPCCTSARVCAVQDAGRRRRATNGLSRDHHGDVSSAS